MQKNKSVVVFYSRLPIKNKSGKTRLGREIKNMERASDFSQTMICDLLKEYSPREKDTYDLVYYYQGELGDFEQKEEYKISEYIQQYSCEITIHTIHKQMAKKYENILIVGSDIPLISHKKINDAFLYIQCGNIVIAPVEDGGYGFIGMSGFIDVYSEIRNWDSRSKGYCLAKETTEMIKKKRLQIYLFSKLFDIDEKSDVQKLWKIITYLEKLKPEYIYLLETFLFLERQKKLFQLS